MGLSGPSLLIILVIVVLLFGTKKLKTIGTDLGGALKGFKKAINEDDADFSENKKVAEKSTESVTASEKQAAKED